tara:strand:- start:8179 stop:11022 length:2844 start_codon:yes stop_codon:yes gene_type:complete
MNDSQRNAATPLFDKINNRVGLRAQSHYLSQSAADKQTQSIARRMLKAETLGAMDLTVNQEVDRIVGSDQPVISTVINPEAVVEFGQISNLLMQEGEARGLSGDALQAFVLQENDKLFTSIVAQKLNSGQSGQIKQVRSLMKELPDGVVSDSKLLELRNKIFDAADEELITRTIIEDAAAGDSLEDVFSTTDALLKNNVYTLSQWQKHRDQAIKYYGQQETSMADQRNELLDQVAELVANGERVPEELKSQAVQFRVKSKFDDIVKGDDTWIQEGKNLWAAYTTSPEAALQDFNNLGAEAFSRKLDAVMPWSKAQEILRSIGAQRATQGKGRRGSSSSSEAKFVTNQQSANDYLYGFVRGMANRTGQTSFMDNDDLSADQKASIEVRWRRDLEPRVRDAMRSEPDKDIQVHIAKQSELLWKSGSFPMDGQTYNKYALADFQMPEGAANLEQDVDGTGRRYVDIAREQLQNEAIEKSELAQMAYLRSQSAPVSPALLGMRDTITGGGNNLVNMRSDVEVRQQVQGTMQASMAMFGTPLPGNYEIVNVPQSAIYARANKLIEDNKQALVESSEKAKLNRADLLRSRLEQVMKTTAWQQFVKDKEISFGENVGNIVSNVWDAAFRSPGLPEIDRPTRSILDAHPRLTIAMEFLENAKIIEAGKEVGIKQLFLQNAESTEDQEQLFRQIVGHHSISNHALEVEPDPLKVEKTTPTERRSAYQRLYIQREEERDRRNPLRALTRKRASIQSAIEKGEANIERARQYPLDQYYDEAEMTFREYIAAQYQSISSLTDSLPDLDRQIEIREQAQNLKRLEERKERLFAATKDPRDQFKVDRSQYPEGSSAALFMSQVESRMLESYSGFVDEDKLMKAREQYDAAKKEFEDAYKQALPEARKLRQREIDQQGLPILPGSDRDRFRKRDQEALRKRRKATLIESRKSTEEYRRRNSD